MHSLFSETRHHCLWTVCSGQKWWMHSLFSETHQRKNVVFLVITNRLKVQLSEDSGQKWWMHSLFSETRRHCLWSVCSGQKWWMHWLGRELKKRPFIFIHRLYLQILWICFIYLGNRHRLRRLCHHFLVSFLAYQVSTPFTFMLASPSTIDWLKAVRSLLSTIVKNLKFFGDPNLRHLFQLSRLV